MTPVLSNILTLFGLFILANAHSGRNNDKVRTVYVVDDEGEFRIQEGNIGERNDWLCNGTLRNDINVTGFAYLDVQTNGEYSNRIQAHCAGNVEGYLTSKLVQSQWYNTMGHFCEKNRENCSSIEEFVSSNDRWREGKQKENEDPYWHHVDLFYTQMEGLYSGIVDADPDTEFTFKNLQLLNLVTEYMDILKALGLRESYEPTPGTTDHCSALIKILPEYKDVYFGHVTWTDYSQMLRIIKKYTLNYTFSKYNKTLIPGYQITTTSFPGIITSTDDYYLTSAGLAVMETTNGVHNYNLFENIWPQNLVFLSARSMIANRLAEDGKSWHMIFSHYNSGTYNNQWMVFDYKLFVPGTRPKKGAFWISEQIPGYIHTADMTNLLVKNGHWFSYNIPFFKDIYEISGYDEMVQKRGTWFSYTEAPRAQIFKRDEPTVTDMRTFMELLRSNDYLNDPFAACTNCTPSHSAYGALSSRGDLNPINGTGESIRKPTGALDAKITNYTLSQSNLLFVAVSGPTTGTGGKLPAFNWSTSNFPNVRHRDHPELWNNEPLIYDWKNQEYFTNY